VLFIDEDCWTEVPDTHSLGGQVHPADSVPACREACWTNNSCDGVDWNPGLPTGQKCWLIGPWNTDRQVSFQGITQYVLNRTGCGKLECHTMRYENMFDVQLNCWRTARNHKRKGKY